MSGQTSNTSGQDKQLVVSIWSLYQKAFPWFQQIAASPPASHETLTAAMETLVPALQTVKQIAKPEDKKWREVKSDVETVLDAWIKASEWGIKYAENPNRGKIANITFWTVAAIETMKKLNKKVAALRL